MSKEGTPFRSIKITLSEEAMDRLAKLRVKGSLRSDSATVEECIRIIYDIATDIGSEIDRVVRGNQKSMPIGQQAEALRRTAIRVGRFIPLAVETITKLSVQEPSAGP